MDEKKMQAIRKRRFKAIMQLIIAGIGMLIGGAYGVMTEAKFWGMLAGMFIGGAVLTWARLLVFELWNFFTETFLSLFSQGSFIFAICRLFVQIAIICVKSFFWTIKGFYTSVSEIVKTTKIIKSYEEPDNINKAEKTHSHTLKQLKPKTSVSTNVEATSSTTQEAGSTKAPVVPVHSKPDAAKVSTDRLAAISSIFSKKVPDNNVYIIDDSFRQTRSAVATNEGVEMEDSAEDGMIEMFCSIYSYHFGLENSSNLYRQCAKSLIKKDAENQDERKKLIFSVYWTSEILKDVIPDGLLHNHMGQVVAMAITVADHSFTAKLNSKIRGLDRTIPHVNMSVEDIIKKCGISTYAEIAALQRIASIKLTLAGYRRAENDEMPIYEYKGICNVFSD